MLETVVVQGLGLIAAALMIASFQCKRSHQLFFLQICSYVVFIIHMLLLGGITGAMTQTVSLVRNIVLYKADNSAWARHKAWLPVFLLAYVVVMLVTWQGVFSILPCIAMLAITIGSWSGNGRNIRLTVLLVNSPAWIIYDIYTGSVAGIIQEIFCMLSSALAFFRYGWNGLNGNGEAAPVGGKNE